MDGVMRKILSLQRISNNSYNKIHDKIQPNPYTGNKASNAPNDVIFGDNTNTRTHTQPRAQSSTTYNSCYTSQNITTLTNNNKKL